MNFKNNSYLCIVIITTTTNTPAQENKVGNTTMNYTESLNIIEAEVAKLADADAIIEKHFGEITHGITRHYIENEDNILKVIYTWYDDCAPDSEHGCPCGKVHHGFCGIITVKGGDSVLCVIRVCEHLYK